MRRINEKQLETKRVIDVTHSVFLILFAFFVLFLPDVFPAASYEELSEKEIIVSWFGRERVSSYRIYTIDGEAFTLTGDFEYGNIKMFLFRELELNLNGIKIPL